MERISKYAFGLEAALLTYPTFLGLLLVAGSLLPILTGARTRGDLIDATVGLIVLLGLICGWRLALSFLFAGRGKTRQISKTCWLTALTIATASLVVAALSRIVEHNTGWAESPLGILEYGILFVPSGVHLAAEVWLRAA